MVVEHVERQVLVDPLADVEGRDELKDQAGDHAEGAEMHHRAGEGVVAAAQFGEVLEINLHGSVRLARAALAVMRPAGYGRIILVASAGGLHGDVGLSAYAASKGGLLAFGRSLAAEGAGRGVLTTCCCRMP